MAGSAAGGSGATAPGGTTGCTPAGGAVSPASKGAAAGGAIACAAAALLAKSTSPNANAVTCRCRRMGSIVRIPSTRVQRGDSSDARPARRFIRRASSAEGHSTRVQRGGSFGARARRAGVQGAAPTPGRPRDARAHVERAQLLGLALRLAGEQRQGRACPFEVAQAVGRLGDHAAALALEEGRQGAGLGGRRRRGLVVAGAAQEG